MTATLPTPDDAPSGTPSATLRYDVRPIGRVVSSLTRPADAPNQAEGAPAARLVFEPWCERAWRDLQVGDQIVVLTWLHRADRTVLTTHPEDDEQQPLLGVFSTRSHERPNPIGLHPATITARGTDWIEVAHLEAVDGTPVVDVKPVLEPR